MRIIFKILAAPFVLVLTLLVAVLSFLLSLSAGLLSILASVLGLLSVLMLFVEKDISTGIAGLLMAFAISPFGLDRKSVVVGKECRSRWSPYH